jgi:hypothetical protein
MQLAHMIYHYKFLFENFHFAFIEYYKTFNVKNSNKLQCNNAIKAIKIIKLLSLIYVYCEFFYK